MNAAALIILGFICGVLATLGIFAPWSFDWAARRRARRSVRTAVVEKSNVVQLPLAFGKRARKDETPRGAA